MSLFNFFRKSEKAIENQVVHTVEPTVNQSLFVDTEDPEVVETEKRQSAIIVFLSNDYMQQGYNDGYLYPSGELMEANIKKLRSDFRMAVDEVIDGKRSAINELKLHQIRTRGISERLEEELIQKLYELENLIHEMDTQKILSVENEGLIAGTLNDYRIGFIKGVEQYRQEKIFAGSTKLF
ncbi:MAG: hypothetical protein H0U27_14300 [Nitrosopumilus sp.]|nr:hypothetical protein [Nitrosopumilus sp.]